MNTWEKCPVCNGIGRIANYGLSNSIDRKCHICNGKGIISSLNGNPPNKGLQEQKRKFNEIQNSLESGILKMEITCMNKMCYCTGKCKKK